MSLETDLQERVRNARSKFVAMAASYSLGVFNDQFFKQAILLLALNANLKAYQGWATVIFTIPFMLFAAPAGWLADRYSKRSVIIGAKALEVVAMVLGGLGLYFVSWPLIFAMLFIMAAQSTLFSPALNGSIPELYPLEFVNIANARIRVVVTAAILLGIACAGFTLNIKGEFNEGVPMGRALVSFAVVGIALMGWVCSLGVPRLESGKGDIKFPWGGPLETLRELYAMKKDLLLTITVAGNAGIWFMASFQYLLINTLGKSQLGLDDNQASMLVVGQMLGVASGGVISGRFGKGVEALKLMMPSSCFMTILMGAMALIPFCPKGFQVVAAAVLLTLIGLFGGLFIIPAESFIQIRPDEHSKGRVWASANFAVFAGIALSGILYTVLIELSLPSTCFLWLAGVSALLTIWLKVVLPPSRLQEERAKEMSI